MKTFSTIFTLSYSCQIELTQNTVENSKTSKNVQCKNCFFLGFLPPLKNTNTLFSLHICCTYTYTPTLDGEYFHPNTKCCLQKSVLHHHLTNLPYFTLCFRDISVRLTTSSSFPMIGFKFTLISSDRKRFHSRVVNIGRSLLLKLKPLPELKFHRFHDCITNNA